MDDCVMMSDERCKKGLVTLDSWYEVRDFISLLTHEVVGECERDWRVLRTGRGYLRYPDDLLRYPSER